MTQSAFKEIIFKYRYLVLILFFGILFLIIAIKSVNPLEYQNSDFFSYWLAGRFTLLSQNPYSSNLWIEGHHQFGASWISDSTFIYPLPLALFFSPLGHFPLYQAFVIWVFLTQFMILTSIALLLSLYPTSLIKRFVLPLLLGAALYRPTILTLANGQVSGLLLLVLCGVLYLWEKEKWWQGASLLAFFALKPNLGIPLIALLSSYLIMKKKIFSLVAEGVCGLLLLFIGIIQNTNWLGEFWGVGNTKLSLTFGYSPTIWGMSAFFCNYKLDCTVGYGLSAGLLIIIGYLYLIAKMKEYLSPTNVASLAILVTLLATPYTWPYDQLLLIIPIFEVTMRLAMNGSKFLPTSLILLIIDIAAFVLLGISARYQVEIWNVAIPLTVSGLVLWNIFKNSPIAKRFEAEKLSMS